MGQPARKRALAPRTARAEKAIPWRSRRGSAMLSTCEPVPWLRGALLDRTPPCRTAAFFLAFGGLSRKKLTGTCFCYTRCRQEIEGHTRRKRKKNTTPRRRMHASRNSLVCAVHPFVCVGGRDVTAKRGRRACWPDPDPGQILETRFAERGKKKPAWAAAQRPSRLRTGRPRPGSGRKDLAPPYALPWQTTASKSR